jgi:hypothetical protein
MYFLQRSAGRRRLGIRDLRPQRQEKVHKLLIVVTSLNAFARERLHKEFSASLLSWEIDTSFKGTKSEPWLTFPQIN